MHVYSQLITGIVIMTFIDISRYGFKYTCNRSTILILKLPAIMKGDSDEPELDKIERLLDRPRL